MTAGSTIVAMSCIRPEDPLPLRRRGSRFDPLTPGGGEGHGEGAPRSPRHPLARPSVTRPCPAAFVTPPLPSVSYVGDPTDIARPAI
jgi:hypothetical protein